jgi:hypothetical protein
MPNHLSIVRKNLANGASIEDCETYLINEGLDNDQILSILDNAARTAPLEASKAKAVNSKNNNGIGIWTVLLIAFFVIRMIMRFMKN